MLSSLESFKKIIKLALALCNKVTLLSRLLKVSGTIGPIPKDSATSHATSQISMTGRRGMTAGAKKGRDPMSHCLLCRELGTAARRADQPSYIPGLGGINAMLVTEVPTHPLTSQTERAWLGAKK